MFHCFPLNPAAGYGLLNPKFLLIKSPWSWIIIPPRNPPRHFFGGQNEQKNGWLKTMKGTNPYFNGSFPYKSSSYWGTPIVGNLHINIHYSLITSFSVRALWLLASTRRRRETCKARRALRQRRLPQGLGQVFFSILGDLLNRISLVKTFEFDEIQIIQITTLRYFELDFGWFWCLNKMECWCWNTWHRPKVWPRLHEQSRQKDDPSDWFTDWFTCRESSNLHSFGDWQVNIDSHPTIRSIAVSRSDWSDWRRGARLGWWKMIRSIHGRYPME